MFLFLAWQNWKTFSKSIKSQPLLATRWPSANWKTFSKSIKSQLHAHQGQRRKDWKTFSKSIKSQRRLEPSHPDATERHFQRASNHNLTAFIFPHYETERHFQRASNHDEFIIFLTLSQERKWMKKWIRFCLLIPLQMCKWPLHKFIPLRFRFFLRSFPCAAHCTITLVKMPPSWFGGFRRHPSSSRTTCGRGLSETRRNPLRWVPVLECRSLRHQKVFLAGASSRFILRLWIHEWI